MNIEFSALEARVIGCLIEKEITTPDQYPLSLNALANACNQKTNREPVLELREADVQQTVDGLMKKYMVSDKSAGYGGRVTKYKHRFCNTEFGSLKFSKQELGRHLRAAAARAANARRAALAHQSPVRIRRCRGGRGDAKKLDGARGRPFHRALTESRGRPRVALCASIFRTLESAPEPESSPPADALSGAPTLSQRVAALEEQVEQLRAAIDALKPLPR